ncbi:N-acetylmuramoyl-L-alanine amidase [Futiania mangrovi]|uniref:N-acetylmuramoyl-L-alanine amidase n=1 Tax=Futiania mangrovi TaxID=2959716 RepID=A0A9J6PDB6_9PROT|nr:N-acetylmuramoyl-L-alanine amidase [Futiania mangrovii]MCP1335683.1 N-acetylmuramoyl-L-alanine amidase [Futiania mangrovii]
MLLRRWLVRAVFALAMMAAAVPAAVSQAAIPVPQPKPASEGPAVPRAKPVTGGEAASIAVQDARLGVSGGRTRFVLDLSGPVPYRVFQLADPYRVVIDMPEIVFLLQTGAGEQTGGLLKRFRYGLFRPGNSRVVLDLDGPAEVASAFALPPKEGNGHRLVLDLKPTDRETFMKAAGWPSDPPFATPGQDVPLGMEPIRRLVVLDAGHGGVDPGAVSPRVGYEKHIVLDFARALRTALARRDVEVVMTRDEDVFIPLADRVRIAREARASLMLSIHADVIEDPDIRGASVYTISEQASDAEAAALASSENRSDVIAGVDLREEGDEVASILIDLARRETKNASVDFARHLVPALEPVTPLLSKPHREAGFRVLKAPDVPSVLIELGFLSNHQDAEQLVQEAWMTDTAEVMADAVSVWLETRPQ